MGTQGCWGQALSVARGHLADDDATAILPLDLQGKSAVQMLCAAIDSRSR